MPEFLTYDALALAMLAALAAGFVTGFAGFGTGLVAAGLWLHVLPPLAIPPLVAIASVAAQLVGFAAVRGSFRWDRARSYLIGAVVGLPLGVWALRHASPELLRTSMGIFLVLYASAQLTWLGRFRVGARGGKPADTVIGAGGGFLGGFAGLSGPLPLV